ncbi:MAG: SlyX family protein [Sulfuricella sp.]|nr:SlyX family protein [Sulfuricella sp.]
MNEDRWIDIESKIAFQEDLLQELNATVYRQQKKIDHLEAVCNSLIEHVRALTEAVDSKPGGGALNERPPHY